MSDNGWSTLVTSDCTLCPQALDPLWQVGRVDYRFPATRADVAAVIHNYDAILCDLAVKFDREMLARAARLRVIATPATGTDHLDKPYLRERGIAQIDI